MKTLPLPWFACLCLLGCSTFAGPDLIKLGEGPGEYAPPIAKADWARFNIIDPSLGKADPLVNFYLKRDLDVDGDTVAYTALYDHRKAEAELRKRYEASAQFNDRFPQFVLHEGEADCEAFKNKATVKRYHDLSRPPFKVEKIGTLTEAAKLVCVLFKNAEKNDFF